MSPLPSDPLAIVPVTGGDDLEIVRSLFAEYAKSIGVDLSFQDFEAELAALPGEYAAPGGRLLLLTCLAQPAGCIALRRWSDDVCEMKRLFVRREFRGQGLARMLVQVLIEEARRMNYQKMRLDTLPTMQAARELYESFGFRPIEPYRHNPVPGAVFMELDLTREEGEA